MSLLLLVQRAREREEHQRPSAFSPAFPSRGRRSPPLQTFPSTKFCQHHDIDNIHEQEMSSPRSVAVVGSLNIDFVTRTSRLPHPGETLQAISFDTGFGGKGANQAVGAARLAGEGVKVRMIGAVGDDGFGNDYFDALGKEGIDTSGVRRLKGEKTGITNIVVDSSGENRIMFIANANMSFKDDEDLVSGQEGDVVVFQLEIPFKTVSRFPLLAASIVAC